MKFVIKFFTLACLSTHALAGPIQVFYEDEPSRAQMVKDIFTQSYQIPEDLIVLMEVKKCTDLMAKGKLDLCLNNNGDLLVVSVDRGFISESLKIFQAP
jgi:DNA/RNA endonuclease YhcR with UshA esterase domain